MRITKLSIPRPCSHVPTWRTLLSSREQWHHVVQDSFSTAEQFLALVDLQDSDPSVMSTPIVEPILRRSNDTSIILEKQKETTLVCDEKNVEERDVGSSEQKKNMK